MEPTGSPARLQLFDVAVYEADGEELPTAIALSLSSDISDESSRNITAAAKPTTDLEKASVAEAEGAKAATPAATPTPTATVRATWPSPPALQESTLAPAMRKPPAGKPLLSI